MGPRATLCSLICTAVLVSNARGALDQDTSAEHDYTIDADLSRTKLISPTLFGVFFEEVPLAPSWCTPCEPSYRTH
jgi:hypothetical protein